jgi:transposase-like protein
MARPTKHSPAFYAKHLPTAVQIEGITLEAIAAKLGLTPTGLRKVLKRLDLPTPAQVRFARQRLAKATLLQPRTRANKRTALWESRREEMKQMLDDGHTPTQLAAHYDVPAYVLHSWIRRFRVRDWLPEGVPHPTAPTIREAKATLLALTPPPVT